MVSTHIDAMRQALELAANINPFGSVENAKARDAAIKALAEQPAQQEPVYFCDYGYEGWGKVDAAMAAENRACGMTVEAYYTSPPAPALEWVPLTQELLNEQHEWLYEPMWIAMKNGSVLQGYYEWRQGWNPDRLLADGGDHWAFDAAYVMPMVKPKPPQAKTN